MGRIQLEMMPSVVVVGSESQYQSTGSSQMALHPSVVMAMNLSREVRA